MRRLLARISSWVLAFCLYDFCARRLEEDLGNAENMKNMKNLEFESWKRARFPQFVYPRHYIVFTPGRTFIMTPVTRMGGSGSDVLSADLASCTPWGILIEARRIRAVLDVMCS
jgi:hypothetical protein